MIDPHQQKILILDFGAQYTQLIARRVREAGVYCEIHPFDMSAAALNRVSPIGVYETRHFLNGLVGILGLHRIILKVFS